MTTNKAGVAKPVVIGAVAIGLLLVAGVAWLLVTTVFQPSQKAGTGSQAMTVGQELDGLKVSAPSLDFSVSPLGESGVSAFDLGEEVSSDLYDDVSVNTDFSAGSVSLSQPSVSLSAPTDFNVQAPSAPASGTDQGSSGSSAPSVDAASCAQFSGVPSCSYVSDPNGQALCNQCKSAGY